jgi:hypothetical protein
VETTSLKTALVTYVVLLFALPSRAQQQPQPTLAQCRAFTHMLGDNPEAVVDKLNHDGTAGDLLVMSTQLARCQERYRKDLSAKSLDELNRVSYRLDALVIQRISEFMQRNKLMDRFNDEEEQRKDQRIKGDR